jgi:exosortase/archaeosortase family protein
MRSFWRQVPTDVKRFLLRALFVFVAWKAMYHLWLQPNRILDKPLVELIAANTADALNIFFKDKPYHQVTLDREFTLHESNGSFYTGTVAQVSYKSTRILYIYPNCDALELMVLYAGFIICFPGSLRRKLWFITIGVVAIHFVNILRCMALVELVRSNWRQYFNFAHHYLFSLCIYLFIFMMWAWFVNGVSFLKKRNESK